MSNSHEESSDPSSSLEFRSERAVDQNRSRGSQATTVPLTLGETDLEQIRAALQALGERAEGLESVELLILSLDIELQDLISCARSVDRPLTIDFEVVDVELMALAYLHGCRVDFADGSSALSPQLGLELFSTLRDDPPASATIPLHSPTLR